jgi:hypothetical protein
LSILCRDDDQKLRFKQVSKIFTLGFDFDLNNHSACAKICCKCPYSPNSVEKHAP